MIRASGQLDGVCYFEGQEKCVKIVSDVSPTEATPVKDPETGEITIQADPQKIEDHKATLWSQLRTERNRLLQQSDWTQLQDAHLSAEKKSAWADYRQALRDLPDEVSITSPEDLVSIDWPLDPTQVPVVPVSGSRLSSLLDAAQ